jgi:hypothetical protein
VCLCYILLVVQLSRQLSGPNGGERETLAIDLDLVLELVKVCKKCMK